jgi:fused signal recognition particle receptor
MKKKGLAARLLGLFAGSADENEFYEELEEILIEADMGATVAIEVVETLRKSQRTSRVPDRESLTGELKKILASYLIPFLDEPGPKPVHLRLVMGVNGVGKTTTIAKLSRYFRDVHGLRGVIFAAGDTFRAAAIEQLGILAERNNATLISQGPGADPAAVIYDSLSAAGSRGDQLVLADTAGRMHNKAHLVAELGKIDRVASGHSALGSYRKYLVIDATTGQNGLRQAEIFHEAVGVDAVILTKYDSTAKGGILVPIARHLSIPCGFIGTGEKPDDMAPFEVDTYLDRLTGADE